MSITHKFCSKQLSTTCAISGAPDKFQSKTRVCKECYKNYFKQYYLTHKTQMKRTDSLLYHTKHPNSKQFKNLSKVVDPTNQTELNNPATIQQPIPN